MGNTTSTNHSAMDEDVRIIQEHIAARHAAAQKTYDALPDADKNLIQQMHAKVNDQFKYYIGAADIYWDSIYPEMLDKPALRDYIRGAFARKACVVPAGYGAITKVIYLNSGLNDQQVSVVQNMLAHPTDENKIMLAKIRPCEMIDGLSIKQVITAAEVLPPTPFNVPVALRTLSWPLAPLAKPAAR